MENTGIEQAHELAALPRRTRVFPPVLRAGLLRNIEFLRSRRIETLQCCIHLEGETPGGAFRIDGERFAARFPYLLLKRPGELHESEFPGGIFSSFYFAYLPGAGAEDLFPPDLHVAEIDLAPPVRALVREIESLIERPGGFGAGDRIDAACARLLQELLLAAERRSAPPSPEAEKIGRAVSRLQLEFAAPDWEKLAAECGFSLRNFTRHWRKVMHCSPAEYAANLRMAEARRLLADTGMRVADIALALGYRSPESFINAFRLRHGVSPLKFRTGGRKS